MLMLVKGLEQNGNSDFFVCLFCAPHCFIFLYIQQQIFFLLLFLSPGPQTPVVLAT